MGEVIFHVFFIIVMGLFFKDSFVITSDRSADPIGPAGFPQILLIIIIVLLLISLFKTIGKLKYGEEKGEPLNLNLAYFGLLLGIIVFIILNDLISFTLSTIVFTFFLFLLLGQKRYVRMFVQSILVAIIFTIIFGKVLSVPLPRGMGILKELTYFLY